MLRTDGNGGSTAIIGGIIFASPVIITTRNSANYGLHEIDPMLGDKLYFADNMYYLRHLGEVSLLTRDAQPV